MIHNTKLSKGLERIRDRFLDQLTDRSEVILRNTLAAVETDDTHEARENLNTVGEVLHQIAGTAGTLGFGQFGSQARSIEHKIEAIDPGSEKDHVSVDLVRELIEFSDMALQLVKRR